MKIKINSLGIIECDKGQGFEKQVCQYDPTDSATTKYCSLRCVKCYLLPLHAPHRGVEGDTHYGTIPKHRYLCFAEPQMCVHLCHGDVIYCNTSNFTREYSTNEEEK